MINERRLYQKNRISYYSLLLFIVTNAVYSVYTLNAMETDQGLGMFIMATILLLLLGFLIAEKALNYSVGWSYGAIVVGVFQISRLFFVESMLEGATAQIMNLILVLSGLFSIVGGIISVVSSRFRARCMRDKEANN